VGVPLLIAINHFLASCNQQAKKLYICQQKCFKFILGYKKGVWFLGSSKSWIWSVLFRVDPSFEDPSIFDYY
jgi:hypothetical protein